ncbi:uncharacterized protein SPSK_09895 [Sporothrix schenckii 1099-18]|uniref:Uncharacterized protein n=1 Tax=Sporothrix schenckii 1099-18 TaxID=1397361 RepID=A0A0F2M7Q0_SPOSC|nr:uncharacterized protein SPSK_09895 [Sporothrix schenckii 1099-18]KJR85099.1 hypothetical protein SPSK_09895 [Sporothrix schenckii 1099-18]
MTLPATHAVVVVAVAVAVGGGVTVAVSVVVSVASVGPTYPSPPSVGSGVKNGNEKSLVSGGGGFGSVTVSVTCHVAVDLACSVVLLPLELVRRCSIVPVDTIVSVMVAGYAVTGPGMYVVSLRVVIMEMRDSSVPGGCEMAVTVVVRNWVDVEGNPVVVALTLATPPLPAVPLMPAEDVALGSK